MPTVLQNGLMVINLTPHDLVFQDERTQELCTAKSDGILNAEIESVTADDKEIYRTVTVKMYPKEEGKRLIEQLKLKYPEALFIGSVVAAQAYPDDVLSVIPVNGKRGKLGNPDRINRSNRFTTYKTGESNVT